MYENEYDEATEEVMRFLPAEHWAQAPRLIAAAARRLMEMEEAAERSTSRTGQSQRDIEREAARRERGK